MLLTSFSIRHLIFFSIDLKEPLMILTNSLGIKSFNVSTSQTHTLYSNGHHIFDVDVLWHPERPQLFWSDYENGSVYGAVITESGKYINCLDENKCGKIKMVVVNTFVCILVPLVFLGLEAIHIIASRGIAAVEGIAVDWIAQNLYWVESQYGWIEMISLKNEWRTAVVTNIEKPRAIALDSRDG